MLTHLIVAGLAFTTAVPAALPSEVICGQHSETCIVIVETPPTTAPPASDTTTTGTARVCRNLAGEVLPCFSETFGWFNDEDRCYYQPAEPPPPSTDPVWNGHHPDGMVWSIVCTDRIPGVGGGWQWLPSPPPGYGDAGITPAQLARRAVDQMRLTGPAIHLTIEAPDTGLVGMPVWLWTDVTPTTWGPNSATASVPGLSVTATARATEIRWDMGDGGTRVCTGPGTPYTPGAVQSPTCDYVYQRSSAGQAGDAYPVTATATWQVTWSGGGTSGSLVVTRTSTTTVRIGELQVLVTG